MKNSLSASGISDAAHLRGAIQQALIQFGQVPNLPSDVSSAAGIDQAGTQALADQNPFSTLKRLQQGYDDQQLATKNQLAARGILNSGESGYQLGRLGQQNAQSHYDATNSLLGNIGGFYDQYAAGQKAAAQQLSQGAFTAESNAAQNSAGGGTATYDPATGLYRDGSGSYYDVNGNPASPQQQAPRTDSAPGGFTEPAAPAPAGVSYPVRSYASPDTAQPIKGVYGLA